MMMSMKKIKYIFAVCAAVLSLCGCAAETQPSVSRTEDYEVTDLLGRTVTVLADASSYVCIGPGALRLYCYVAEDGQLAGVENFEQDGGAGRPYAMSVSGMDQLPVIGPGGPGNVPDAERLLAAGPDVIFSCYNTDASSVDELQEKTGIPVVSLSYGTGRLFDETVYDSLRLIGTITGHADRAEEVVGYFEEMKADLSERAAGADEKPSVYLGGQSSRGSHGIESTTGDYPIFDVLGAVNVVAEAGIHEYVMLDKEKLLEMDPEIIILDAGGLSLVQEDYQANPEFYRALQAVKNGQVYMQMPFNYYTTNLEIALADAWYIGSVLYPEQFGDIDPAAKFDEISNLFLGIDTYEAIASQYYGGFQQVTLGETAEPADPES